MRMANVVLAAGASRRFGSKKTAYKLENNQSILENILDKINKMSVSDATQMIRVVVLNDDSLEDETDSQNPFEIHKDILKGWKVLINRDYQKGISTSIKKAVEKCISADIDGILLFLGDMPFVPGTLIRQVIDASKERPGHFIRPIYHDTPGFPVFIPRRFFKELLTLTGDKGAMGIIRAHREALFTIQTEQKGCIFDIDHQDDLKEIQKAE